MLIRSGLGLSFGVVFSVLLFKRRAWPAFVGLGFGAGRAWEECDNVRLLKYSTNMWQQNANIRSSPSSEQQSPQKTASALSDHKLCISCGQRRGTRSFCVIPALHAEHALYSRAWYRSFGKLNAIYRILNPLTPVTVPILLFNVLFASKPLSW